MNKRKRKKREKREKMLLDIWGYPMTYKEQREMERSYHEYHVSVYCRNQGYDYEAEEYANIIGIPYVYRKLEYHYPNRFRWRKIDRCEK